MKKNKLVYLIYCKNTNIYFLVNIDLLFNKAALNIVWKFVSNQRYEYDDHRMHKVNTLIL